MTGGRLLDFVRDPGGKTVFADPVQLGVCSFNRWAIPPEYF
jgi:hypothetical protein